MQDISTPDISQRLLASARSANLFHSTIQQQQSLQHSVDPSYLQKPTVDAIYSQQPTVDRKYSQEQRIDEWNQSKYSLRKENDVALSCSMMSVEYPEDTVRLQQHRVRALAMEREELLADKAR